MAHGAPGAVLSRWRLVSRRSARRGISLIARRRQDRPQRRHGMGDRGDGRVRQDPPPRKRASTLVPLEKRGQRQAWQGIGKPGGSKTRGEQRLRGRDSANLCPQTAILGGGSVRARASKYNLCSRTCGDVTKVGRYFEPGNSFGFKKGRSGNPGGKSKELA